MSPTITIEMHNMDKKVQDELLTWYLVDRNTTIQGFITVLKSIHLEKLTVKRIWTNHRWIAKKSLEREKQYLFCRTQQYTSST